MFVEIQQQPEYSRFVCGELRQKMFNVLILEKHSIDWGTSG
jgi:hypothetical protein